MLQIEHDEAEEFEGHGQSFTEVLQFSFFSPPLCPDKQLYPTSELVFIIQDTSMAPRSKGMSHSQLWLKQINDAFYIKQELQQWKHTYRVILVP